MTAATERRRLDRSVPRAGWMVVARKEFSDHLLSARFLILFIILGLAAGVPLYFLSGNIRDAAEAAGESIPALFIALYWLGPQVNEQITLPSVVGFLTLVGPLLGLTFAFDAINGERAEGTLPRLLSQPIHRDDVINGKFAAGIAVISLVLISVITAIAAFGIFRLGIVPTPAEVLRLVVWVAVTIVYVSMWLAFGMLLSVVVRRGSTSALIGFGIWLLLAIFGTLVVSLIAGVLAPSGGTTTEEVLQNQALQENLYRLLPQTLYGEASLTLLNPQVSTISTPTTVDALDQARSRVASLFSLDQSFILVWPQVVGLVAITTALFALAYVQFMRQEVRA